MPESRAADPWTEFVLVRPREEGNVGAAARAIANMGFGRLTLVEPAVAIGPTARAFATSAGWILDGLRRVDTLEEAVASSQRVLGTTSSRERALGVPVVAPDRLTEVLRDDPPATRRAIVFGPEVSGLTREELARCGLWIRIPSHPNHPTLNLAQSVLLVAYELRRLPSENESALEDAAEPLAANADLERLFARWTELLRRAGFARDDSYAGVERDLRALLHRAAPRQREISILQGIARRLARRLEPDRSQGG